MSDATETHQRLYLELHQGDEVWIAAVRQGWEGIARELRKLQGGLDGDLTAIEPDWKGPASDSFRAVMNKLKRTVSEAEQTANRANMALEDAETALIAAKEAGHPPPPQGPPPGDPPQAYPPPYGPPPQGPPTGPPQGPPPPDPPRS